MKRLREKKSIKKTSKHHASEGFANIVELLEHYDTIRESDGSKHYGGDCGFGGTSFAKVSLSRGTLLVL